MIYGDDNIHDAMEKVAGLRRLQRINRSVGKKIKAWDKANPRPGYDLEGALYDKRMKNWRTRRRAEAVPEGLSKAHAAAAERMTARAFDAPIKDRSKGLNARLNFFERHHGIRTSHGSMKKGKRGAWSEVRPPGYGYTRSKPKSDLPADEYRKRMAEYRRYVGK